MLLPEEIKTIEKPEKFLYKEKNSEFIAEIFPVNSEEVSQSFLASVRKRYFDANHHCFAFKLHDGLEKYSDDGEPKGTAGLRILNAIKHFDLTDIILIVTRYFGGTKLGVGPLGKAYYKASIGVLEKAEIVSLDLYQQVEILSSYENSSVVYRLVDEHKAKIVKSDFSESAKFVCIIKAPLLENFSLELKNASNGQILTSHSKNFTYEKSN